MAEFLRNEKDTEQELIFNSDSKEAISSNRGSGHDENAAG